MKYLLITMLTIFALEFICIPIYVIYNIKKYNVLKNEDFYRKLKLTILSIICGFVGVSLLSLIFYIWGVM